MSVALFSSAGARAAWGGGRGPVYLYWEEGRGATLVHDGLEYPPERFCTGASFAEDADNVLDGHFRAYASPWGGSGEAPLAARAEGMTALFSHPPSGLESYVGVGCPAG